MQTWSAADRGDGIGVGLQQLSGPQPDEGRGPDARPAGCDTQLIELYWTIGKAILDRQKAEGWGTRVIDRLSDDLRAAYPDMRGLSRSNIHYMRQMAAAWSESAVVPQPVGQLPGDSLLIMI